MLQRSSRIACRCYIPNLKSLSSSSLCFGVLQTCCCPAAEELQNHLEMLHTKFEVSRSCGKCSRVLQNCCKPSAEMLQSCCRLTADYEGTLSRDAACQF